MDWAFVHKVWDKWASNSVGSSGEYCQTISKSHAHTNANIHLLVLCKEVSAKDLINYFCRCAIESCFAN